jgi:hypothetical protein
MEQLPKIAQQRLQATAAARVHPDPDLLAAFAERSLQERERAQVLQHLAQCADCRSVVSLALPEMAEPPARPAKSPWLGWPVLRWSALAACVVVVTAAVTLHYEQRQSVEPIGAEKASLPASPTDLTVEGQAAVQSNEKLAAKIAPASPFPSDRDFAAAGKLAKPLQDMGASSATGAPAINGLATGRQQKQQAENAPAGAGELRVDRLTDNQLAKADARRSTDRPSAPPVAQLAAAAPQPPPLESLAPKSKTANTEEQARERKEALDYAARGSSETVTVEAAPAQIETTPAALARAKDEADKKALKTAVAGLKESPRNSRNVQSSSTLNGATPKWTLSPDGALQRSYDSGRTWETIQVASHVVVRALAANGSDIWVGGASGALYHSSDAGQHWIQVQPVADGKALTADIVGVEFDDIQHGRLITGARDTWTTSDGGASWHRR